MKKKIKEQMLKSAKDLALYMKTLNLSYEQAKSLNSLILKHVDDCVRWGIQIKLGAMLEEMKNEE
ncbi:hypothetical protein [Fusobacterium necrophorum]|uniref:hypothetical protein n=1 Tax=Fusobacterium necrophorum TaxID=859 RepID=UPI00370E689C|nr:hypothetical protein [Fusobacterium necrophorum]